LLDLGGTLNRRSDVSYEEAAIESMQRAWITLGEQLTDVMDQVALVGAFIYGRSKR